MLWIVAVVLWTAFAFGAALLMGAAGRVAKRGDRAERLPLFVPAHWSLTNTR